MKMAYEAIMEVKGFQENNYPVNVNENVEKALQKGTVYIHGRDKRFRPFMIVKVKHFQQMKADFTNLDTIILGIIAFEYFKYHLAVPGKIENINLILDCQDMNVFTAPYMRIKVLLQAIQSQFKCICKTIFVLNSPATFSIFYNGVKGFINEMVRSKIQIHSTNTCDQLLDIALPEQIEQKYGGTSPNLSLNFWPATMPSFNFGVDQSLLQQDEHLPTDHCPEDEGFVREI